ncbi:MAG: hypothetical protein APF81_12240 [Desulfosporosinus sp. BRH_c37]|nr:MAG: hypothetical protein APF81_12240 [Desulfosporosinus sp. BRH_c37]
MTGKEKKRVQYKRLIVDIKDDLNSIRKITDDIKGITQVLENEKGMVRGSDLMACAGYLHHFYTGIESVFERISRAFDGGLTSGGDYHREVLRSMTIEIPDIRPSIISRDLAEELDEYRRFRHMFRHSYGSELRWRKMEPLAKGIDSMTKVLDERISEFMHFIEKLSDSIAH